MKEITFVITEAEEGGFNARALGHSVFTQGATRQEIETNVRDAVLCHFEPEEAVPKLIHLHYVHDQVIAV